MEERRKRLCRDHKERHPRNQGPSRQVNDENIFEPNKNEDSSDTLSSSSDENKSNLSSSEGKVKKSNDTPAPVFNRNLLAPGAPRILVENQQANAEPVEQPEILNIDSFGHQHYLRTPPSIKNQKLFIRGSWPYRGFDRFDRVSDEIILRVFHFLPRHLMCTCALVCRRWARIVCDMSLWKRMDLGGKLVKKGVLKIILERGVQILRLNRSEIQGDFASTVVGIPDPRRSPLSEDRLYRLQLLDMSMANVETSLVENMLKFCPNLTKISLENIPVTEQLLINLSLNSPYLDSLNLCMSTGVTGRGLCHIFQNCSSLSELNIAWTGLSAAELLQAAQCLPRQMLSLNMSGGRERLLDPVVTAICNRCPRLQDLDISDATHITNDAIDEIINHLNELKMIAISRCYKITPQYIANLKDLPDLERINIFGIMRDVTLEMLEQHLSRYKVNRFPFSAIARPTVNNNRFVRIWNKNPRQL